MWGVWDLAHSTPLELAFDLGLPLAGLIVLAWLIVLYQLSLFATHLRCCAGLVPTPQVFDSIHVFGPACPARGWEG
jgi:hypothetical protein